jgi:8-oxo-dGTP pyrophosphatase MutT (NUDIX family)
VSLREPVPTEIQVSAGGVTFRKQGDRVEVALISVGEQLRWQLPKGMVAEGETHEQAALREVREETGLAAEVIAPLDKVEYWFYASRHGRRVRFHKFVHFFLMRFLDGSVSDHDFEVNEARWVEIGKAQEMLAFESDRRMVALARERIENGEGP